MPRSRLLRKGLVPLLLILLLAGLVGWLSLPLLTGETLYVMLVTQRRLDWLRRQDIQHRSWQPLLDEFQRLHPNVQVSLYTVEEDGVREALKRRTARGLGPDLLLLRVPLANTLIQEGLIAPVPTSPGMERAIAQVGPRFLKRVDKAHGLAGVPLTEQVTLACFNRQTVPSPPRSTEELMAMAAAGKAIGLSADPYGIWWTAGTRGADQAIVPILTGLRPVTEALRAKDEATITAWLAWLRQIAQQSKVDLASGPEELSQGLIAGRLDLSLIHI